MSDIESRVRAWARGLYPTEAGIEVLIRQGKAIREGAPWLTPHGDLVSIDVDRLLDATGAWSGGERRVVAIAASLLGGPALDLSEVIPGLDRDNAALVLAAIAHANGSHEHDGAGVDPSASPRPIRKISSSPTPVMSASTRPQPP